MKLYCILLLGLGLAGAAGLCLAKPTAFAARCVNFPEHSHCIFLMVLATLSVFVGM